MKAAFEQLNLLYREMRGTVRFFHRRQIIANAEIKSARIETPVSAEQKEMIERAAAYVGLTVSEFVLGNVEQAAKAVIDEREKLKLDRQQSRALVESLLAPASPNKALRAAARDHRKRVTSR